MSSTTARHLGTFNLMITVRRLKLTGPLSKAYQNIYLRFNGEKKIQVPPDQSDKRDKAPTIVNFVSSQQGTVGLTLNLSESATKIPIDLMAVGQLLSIDDTVLATNQCSLRKLHQVGGLIKTEVRLYTDNDEHRHICSLYIELEKKGARPTQVQKQVPKKQLGQVASNLLEMDFPAFESLSNKVRAKGFNRLTPEQKLAISQAEPQVIKRVDWKDHIGIKDNIEIVKILELIYGLLCNLDLFLAPIYWFYDIVQIKNKLHTTIFLLCASILILFFETVFPLAMVCAAFKMLHILYEHETFTPMQPDVKHNIYVIQVISDFVNGAKYNIDQFFVDVIFWRDPKQSSKLCASLLIASVMAFIGLKLVSVRVILVVCVWSPVLYHSQFFCDVFKVVMQSIGEVDINPMEVYLYKKSEQFVFWCIDFQKWIMEWFEWITCKKFRAKWQRRRTQALAGMVNLPTAEEGNQTANDEVAKPADVQPAVVQEVADSDNEYDDFSGDDQTTGGAATDIDTSYVAQDEPQREATTQFQQGLTMEIIVYENERWWLGQGWCDKMLPQERSNWSDLGGHMYMPKSQARLPGKNWQWTSDWQISRCTRKYMKDRPNQQVDHDCQYDQEGWQYAIEWGTHFYGNKGMSHLVRRRRWIRTCMAVPDFKTVLKQGEQSASKSQVVRQPTASSQGANAGVDAAGKSQSVMSPETAPPTQSPYQQQPVNPFLQQQQQEKEKSSARKSGEFGLRMATNLATSVLLAAKKND